LLVRMCACANQYSKCLRHEFSHLQKGILPKRPLIIGSSYTSLAGSNMVERERECASFDGPASLAVPTPAGLCPGTLDCFVSLYGKL